MAKYFGDDTGGGQWWGLVALGRWRLRYGLPVLAPKGLTLEKLMEKMAVDKQLGWHVRVGSVVMWVLEIGNFLT